ncbi:MAG: glucose-6-phosphate isomerase [Thaumarchaeota archaeon 13_1_40CM_4_38_7]|nr:MAG: glucose-6-phosphate isomerase [Thaumarchaeota archaeon 13_1_40CM_4_38_7]
MSLATLKKYDLSEMHDVYDAWPEIAKESYDSDQETVDFRSIDHIVFAGMGGSGALGDIFSAILSKTNLHVAVAKGYHLPSTVDSNTLVVTTSISGNTVETLTVLEAARKLKCNIIAFSSGGKMENYCIKHKIEYRNIQQLHSPRASFPNFLYTILRVMGPVIPVKKHDISDSINKLEKNAKEISSANLTQNNPSLTLAKWITGIPIIYYPFGFQAAAVRFKNSIQENAKTHAIIEDVIEACHNGIVAWEKYENVMPILLEGEDDYVKTKERWKILKEYFYENEIDYWEVPSVRGSILSKLINLIYRLDYTSIYRAILSKVDPTPIDSIDFIKDRL